MLSSDKKISLGSSHGQGNCEKCVNLLFRAVRALLNEDSIMSRHTTFGESDAIGISSASPETIRTKLSIPLTTCHLFLTISSCPNLIIS